MGYVVMNRNHGTIPAGRWRRASAILSAFVGTAALAAGCQSDLEPPPSPSPTPAQACHVEDALGPLAAGQKVKALLTGGALSADEVAALEADPTALRGLVTGWVDAELGRDPREPALTSRPLLRFLMSAFQQTNLDIESLTHQLGGRLGNLGTVVTDDGPVNLALLLAQNFSESFARTAFRIAKEGRSWKEVVTTKEQVLTPALQLYIDYADDVVIQDDGSFVPLDPAFEPIITLTDDPDQHNPDGGVLYHHGLVANLAGCNPSAPTPLPSPVKVGPGAEFRFSTQAPHAFGLLNMMLGRHLGIVNDATDPSELCGIDGDAVSRPWLVASDFTDWRVVELTNEVENRPFFELDRHREATTLGVARAHSGFLSSLGFLGSWTTNVDNSARVTVNQALIVALGAAFDGQTVLSTVQSSGDDHAANAECRACHDTLDPMRNLVRGSWSVFYGQQTSPPTEPTFFDFGGERHDFSEGEGRVTDFATILAEHPLFAGAWADKLCYYANGAPCVEGEELDRVLAAFTEEHDFRTLIVELFSSPLVTGRECLDEADGSNTDVSISRRSTFCAQLSDRLGVADACGLSEPPEVPNQSKHELRRASSAVPDDAFSRGTVAPIVITDPSMMGRANRESSCLIAADQLSLAGRSNDEAAAWLVIDVMGLPPGTARHDAALDILRGHLADVMAADGSTADPHPLAQRSAFVVACMAPTLSGLGF